MEKLKKYNQRLLAIIGTLAVLLLLGLTIVSIVALIKELTRPKYVQVDDSITIDTPSEDSIKYRDQSITFENPILVDTLGFNYLVPVSQIKLKVPEYYNQYDLIASDGISYEKEYYTSYRREGYYNNFIIHNQKTGKQTILFEEKTFLSSYQFFKADSNVYIMFVGANADSNKDKKLNFRDLKSFYFYDLNKDKITKIQFDNMSLYDFHMTYNSSLINLEFALDKNKNGEINESEEPVFIKTFNYHSREVTDLIDQEIMQQVQRTID